jgi:hypothetical protein
MSFDTEWAELRKHYRVNITRVMNNIREGSVDELDIDKLHNFHQDCFMLMSKVPMAVWRKAEKDAELASLLKDVEDDWNKQQTACTDISISA